ncbi:MAG: 2'-5' RNA ligase family protein [Minisyncoccota bacterium]
MNTYERVFVGIKVPLDLARDFADFHRDIVGLPAHLIHPTDMHLTLVPPWDITDRASVESILREVLRGGVRFLIRFERVEYGPTEHRPWLVWVIGEPSLELTNLKKSLVDAFGVKDVHLSFTPHVTIARFSEQDWAAFKHHPIAREAVLSMPVESVELFLTPTGGGRNHEVLASVPLK